MGEAEEPDASARDVPRISSGTPHLDVILCGGWLRGGTYIVRGPPGTGKTTLGNQFCFVEADRGGSCVYVTLLAETHGRMMLHLRSMAFFRPEQVGKGVYYLSGFSTLNTQGLDGLLHLLQQTVRERHASVLVIDGLGVLREKASSPMAFRQFLQALAAFAALTGCTVLMMMTEDSQKAMVAEYAMVDGILALSAELRGLQATRSIEVIKFRGSNNLPGKHTLLINENGLRIFPRWESVHSRAAVAAPDLDSRLSLGIPRLDAMCGGGLVRLSTTMLLGSPGSGKTLLGLSFLAEGARHGEPGLYFGFAENGKALLRKGRSIGLDIEPLVERGLLRLEARAPVETLPDALAQELLEQVERHGVRRLMIDGLEPFAREVIDPDRAPRFVSALFNVLRDRGVTVVATQQTHALFGPELRAPLPGVEGLSDNVLLMRFFELEARLYRLISVLKMRDSDNDPHMRELLITSEGMDVAESFEAIEAILTGQAHGKGPSRRRPAPSGSRKKPAPRATPRKPSRRGGRT
jgi:circadian clock protein KaiC